MKPASVTTTQWIKYNMYFVLEHLMGIKRFERRLRAKKLRFFNEVLNNNPGFRERAATMETKDIEHYSFDAFKNNKSALLNGPLVFRGVAKDWPSVKNWSKDFFRDQYGNVPVTIIDNPGLIEKDKDNEFKQTNFAEYFKDVEKDKSKYLRFSRVLDNNPVLLKDLDMDWLRQFKSRFSMGDQTFLFIGEGDTKTPMHGAISHTAFVQIKGKKRWVICAPNERFFLDPVAARALYFYTNADINNPIDPEYPLLPYVRKYDVIMDEGDVLWLPSFTWHHVENVTSTIGVAFKYQNLFETMKMTKVMLVLNFLATKPSIFRSVIYNMLNKQDLTYNTKSSKFQ